jgi:hypothetical protein
MGDRSAEFRAASTAARVLSTLVSLRLILALGLVGACDPNRSPEPVNIAPEQPSSNGSSPTPLAPSTSVPQPSSMSSAEAPPVELFQGAPDPGVKLVAEVRYATIVVETPAGWREPFRLSGTTWSASADDGAAVLIYSAKSDETRFDAFLGAPLGSSTIVWQPPAPASVGRDALAARIEAGSGKLGGAFTQYAHHGPGTPWTMSNRDQMDRDEGAVWRIVLDRPDNGRQYILLAALKNAGGDARRRELVAVVRSLRWR